MVDIPDSLRSLYSATVEQREDSYVIEVPRAEIDNGAITPETTYRIAMLERASSPTDDVERTPNERKDDRSPVHPTEQKPPVEEGERRDVTIESLGDKGDGIAKVERGYVLIVPETQPGDEVTVEVDQVRENVAFAERVDGSVGQ